MPGIGLYNFIRERSELKDVIVKSPAGVDFIGGSGDVLGMAHITKFEKIKILTNIQELDYDYTILDLGAGTSFNMVDLFNVADIKIDLKHPRERDSAEYLEHVRELTNNVKKAFINKPIEA